MHTPSGLAKKLLVNHQYTSLTGFLFKVFSACSYIMMFANRENSTAQVAHYAPNITLKALVECGEVVRVFVRAQGIRCHRCRRIVRRLEAR